VSPFTNASYIINSTMGGSTFDDAESSCIANGGHLVVYQSLDEHKDVEQHFITYGFFLPESHKVRGWSCLG
jgi:hypothetical protein